MCAYTHVLIKSNPGLLLAPELTQDSLQTKVGESLFKTKSQVQGPN